jgi:hypothetical protein
LRHSLASRGNSDLRHAANRLQSVVEIVTTSSRPAIGSIVAAALLHRNSVITQTQPASYKLEIVPISGTSFSLVLPPHSLVAALACLVAEITQIPLSRFYLTCLLGISLTLIAR